jgi:hypothetical protein
MRRMIWLVMLALLALPMAAFAQEQETAWELRANNHVNITDLGFRFYYPLGWTLDTSRGIAMVEDEADLEALIDNTGDTNPEGLAIRIIGLPLDQAPEGADTLDELVDILLELTELNETERVEVPVMGRRSISVFGNSATSTRAGLLTAWMLPDYVVLAGLSAPDLDTLFDLAYTWGMTIGSIEPLNALELGDEPLTAEIAGFTVQYPDGWLLNEDISEPGAQAIFENEADFENLSTPEGYVLAVLETPLADLGLEGEEALERYAALVKQSQGFDDTVTAREFVILDQPALTYKGQNAQTDYWGLITVTVVNDTAVALIMVAPTEDLIDTIEPTWTAILQSIDPVEA